LQLRGREKDGVYSGEEQLRRQMLQRLIVSHVTDPVKEFSDKSFSTGNTKRKGVRTNFSSQNQDQAWGQAFTI